MARGNPIGEGFRAVVRNPQLFLAEVAWRWAFGAAALALIAIGLREVQLAVKISPTDELLIRTLQPMLIAEAWAHILRETLPFLARLAAVLLPALTLMWIAPAAMGRMATTRGLLDHFAKEYQLARSEVPARWGAMIALHALRAALVLAVFLGYVGAAVLASRFTTTSAEGIPQIEGALVVFVLVFAIVVIVAAALNWILALAPVFVVRDGLGTWESLSAALQFSRSRGSQFTSAATINGFIRFGVAFLMSVVGLFPLTLAGVVPSFVVFGIFIVLTFVYFLISDWLLLSRLAAYVALVEQARAESLSPTAPA